jgi:dGTPase
MQMVFSFASRPGEGGLRISYATLGAFMKYPKKFAKKPTNNISDKSTVSSNR